MRLEELERSKLLQSTNSLLLVSACGFSRPPCQMGSHPNRQGSYGTSLDNPTFEEHPQTSHVVTYCDAFYGSAVLLRLCEPPYFVLLRVASGDRRYWLPLEVALQATEASPNSFVGADFFGVCFYQSRVSPVNGSSAAFNPRSRD
jgi:hypothetical protein